MGKGDCEDPPAEDGRNSNAGVDPCGPICRDRRKFWLLVGVVKAGNPSPPILGLLSGVGLPGFRRAGVDPDCMTPVSKKSSNLGVEYIFL